PGELTFPVAVNRANVKVGADTIRFSSLFDTPRTVQLTGGRPLEITDDLTIAPPVALTIQGDGNGPISVKRATAALSDLTLRGGSIALACLEGTVNMADCTISDNTLSPQPQDHDISAAVQNSGTITMISCTVSGNRGSNAVSNNGAMTMTDC